MATMGKYCKAYEVRAFRAYPRWDSGERTLREDDVLYLQENLVVTEGIFKDEQVIFSDVDEAWQVFCRDTLGFRVPDWHYSTTTPDSAAGEGSRS